MATQQEMINAKNNVQSIACQAIAKRLEEDLKCILNMATGTGKTRTAYKLIFHNYVNVKTILFMVPKQSLVNQTANEWSETAATENKTFNYTTVYAAGETKTVEDLEAFMSQPGINVVFAVYNSVGLEDSIIQQVNFDLAIYDECHRVAGKEPGLFTSCTLDTVVQAKYKVFMTATMRSYQESEEGTTPEFDMNNSDIFGQVAFSISVAEAIRLNLLVPFDTYFLEVSDSRIKAMLKKEVRFLDELVKGRQLAAVYAVLKAYNSGSRKVLVMYHQKQHAHDFNNLFRFMQREYNFLPGAVINCVATDVTPAQLGAPSFIKPNDSLAARQWFLKHGPFSTSETAIATSSPWIKEGEDVPCIDTVVFGDRFNSGIDIIQIIGRALRWFDGKDKATIILPVLEGEANKAARAIQTTVRNLQENTSEVQMVTQEFKAPSNNDIPSSTDELEEEVAEENNETTPRHDRWVFDTDETSVTTLDINQGEYSLNIVHDDTFSQQARVDHDEMLNTVSLKLSGGYKKFLIGERADNFIRQVVNQIENTVNSKKPGTSANSFKTYEKVYENYASYYSIDIEEAIEEIGDRINLIDEAYKKVASKFLPFV